MIFGTRGYCLAVVTHMVRCNVGGVGFWIGGSRTDEDMGLREEETEVKMGFDEEMLLFGPKP